MRRWTETLDDGTAAVVGSGRVSPRSVALRGTRFGPVNGLRPDPAASRRQGGAALRPGTRPAEGESSAGGGTAPRGVSEARMHEPPVFVLRVDGGSRGNPGPSAIGVVLEDDQGTVLEEIGACIGTATNNEAEYQALITGLRDRRRTGGYAGCASCPTPSCWCARCAASTRCGTPRCKELYLQARDVGAAVRPGGDQARAPRGERRCRRPGQSGAGRSDMPWHGSRIQRRRLGCLHPATGLGYNPDPPGGARYGHRAGWSGRM